MASEAWPLTRLDKHVDLASGYAFKSAEFTEDEHDIRLLRGANVSQGGLDWGDARRWPADRLSEVKEYLLRAGDVVLAMDRPWIEAGLKYARVVDRDLPALLVQRVARLRAQPGLDQRFLYYVIGSPSFTNHVLAVQTGSTVPHISGRQVLEHSFRLPPLKDQLAIAEVLGSLDDCVESNRRLASTLGKAARTTFDGHVLQHPERDSWAVVPLGELVSLDKGVSYKGEFLGEGRPMVNLGVFRGDGETDWSKIKHYAGDVKPRHELAAGDLVIAHVDVTQNRVVLGSPGIVPPQFTDPIFTGDVYRVTWRSDEFRRFTHLVYCCLLQEDFRERARGFATGTTVLRLPKDAVLEYEIALPPDSVLERVDALWSTAFEKQWQMERESQRLTVLRDTLLPKLVSGELRIPDPDRLLEAVV